MTRASRLTLRTSPGRGGPGGTNVMTRMMTKTLTRMMTRILRMMTTTHLAHKPRQGRSRGHQCDDKDDNKDFDKNDDKNLADDDNNSPCAQAQAGAVQGAPM